VLCAKAPSAPATTAQTMRRCPSSGRAETASPSAAMALRLAMNHCVPLNPRAQLCAAIGVTTNAASDRGSRPEPARRVAHRSREPAEEDEERHEQQ
jgi:hypothetical protein